MSLRLAKGLADLEALHHIQGDLEAIRAKLGATPIDELRAQIAERRARLEALENEDDTPLRNRRYVVQFNNIPFQTVGNNSLTAANLTEPAFVLEEQFVVDAGTRFYVKSIEATFSLTGTYIATGSSIIVTIPPAFRKSIFDFVWRIRDTGADREWSNRYVPASVLCTGYKNGFKFRRAHALLSGGAQVFMNVGVTRFFNNSQITQVTNPSAGSLRVSLCGVEVDA